MEIVETLRNDRVEHAEDGTGGGNLNVTVRGEAGVGAKAAAMSSDGTARKSVVSARSIVRGCLSADCRGKLGLGPVRSGDGSGCPESDTSPGLGCCCCC